MKIIKYKKLKSDKYKIFLEDESTMELYEDTILKYNLLISKEIKKEDLDELEKFNYDLDAYYIALKYLDIRPRSKKEINDYLLKKGFSNDIISDTISKLETQGYLNDLAFGRVFLNNKLITTSNGPLKVRKELQQHNLNIEDINTILEEYTDDIQVEKINKQINRIIKSNRNKGNVYIKRKIYNDLNNEGFNSSLIEEELNHLELEDDTDLAKKEYDKLYKKLSKKYTGSELEFKINQKLYQKGFHYEK